MKFWDSSALVPLLVEEPNTGALASLYARDPVIVTWWATEVECASAVARLERDGDLTIADANEAFDRLTRLTRSWHEIQPADKIRETAKRLLRVHDLRPADALQLAAAVVVAEHRPPTLDLVCLDERLALAAAKEGYSPRPVTGPGQLPAAPARLTSRATYSGATEVAPYVRPAIVGS